MSSKIIKFVAGGGKTTFCSDYLKQHKNGLYLAFNNSVVNRIQEQGFLSRTIDSFFQSYIIPKFTSCIPIIAKGSEIEYINSDTVPERFIGALTIKIDSSGDLYCKSVKTCFSLKTTNTELHNSHATHSYFLKYLFNQSVFKLTDDLRDGISSYLICNYGRQIIETIRKRFSYVIIDEAQDLSRFKESFVQLLFESEIDLIVLGDDYQNINGGGQWFENKTPDEIRNTSFRCPNDNCDWIRNHLGIDIYGNGNSSEFNLIDVGSISELDNGEVTLLYSGRSGEKLKSIVDNWKGPKETIKKAKGETINTSIAIVGETLNKKAYYTAITRTTKNVYSTIKKIN